MIQNLPSKRCIHLVGVGGMGMMPLAVGLAEAGWEVTGEDAQLTHDVAEILNNRSVVVKPLKGSIGQEHPPLVVFSAAVKADHPARTFAQEKKIPQCSRGEFLAQYARGKKLIAICGSHGKSSTSAMVAHGIRELGLIADYYVGAKFASDAIPSARLAGASVLVAELDESDGSHLNFEPECLCILNMDWDHSDKYPNEAAYRESFYALARKTRSTVWVPEAEVSVFKEKVRADVQVCGLEAQSDFVSYNNAVAGFVLETVGGVLTPDLIARFPSIERRQDCLWQEGDSSIWHDYAHHPREIDAFLKWLKAQKPEMTIEVFFEPHRYSRTLSLADDLIAALQFAEKIAVMPIYAAGESLESFDSEKWGHAMELSGKPVVRYSSHSKLFAHLSEESSFPKNTARAFVGAGDIGFLAQTYSKVMQGDRATFAEILKERLGDSFVREREMLSGKTTMRVGGEAEVYVEPPDRAMLSYTLRLARLFGISVFFLGKGSNLIVPDSGIQGCVVRLNQPEWLGIEILDNGCVQVGAGVRLRDICKEAEKGGLAGFEFMEGIPASLGGALRMNAGAMGGWMSDVIDSIEVMTLEGTVRILSKGDLHYSYRSIEELKNCVVLSAKLMPSHEVGKDVVKAQIKEHMLQRKKSQPREASAGCIFKNPEGDKAGRLIDQCGLKGARFGDAQVSEVHANFIVNLGAATAEDILQLVSHIRKEVEAQTGILLEPEAILVGSEWEAALS